MFFYFAFTPKMFYLKTLVLDRIRQNSNDIQDNISEKNVGTLLLFNEYNISSRRGGGTVDFEELFSCSLKIYVSAF